MVFWGHIPSESQVQPMMYQLGSRIIILGIMTDHQIIIMVENGCKSGLGMKDNFMIYHDHLNL